MSTRWTLAGAPGTSANARRASPQGHRTAGIAVRSATAGRTSRSVIGWIPVSFASAEQLADRFAVLDESSRARQAIEERDLPGIDPEVPEHRRGHVLWGDRPVGHVLPPRRAAA